MAHTYMVWWPLDMNHVWSSHLRSVWSVEALSSKKTLRNWYLHFLDSSMTQVWLWSWMRLASCLNVIKSPVSVQHLKALSLITNAKNSTSKCYDFTLLQSLTLLILKTRLVAQMTKFQTFYRNKISSWSTIAVDMVLDWGGFFLHI